jgi:hypothetical protein
MVYTPYQLAQQFVSDSKSLTTTVQKLMKLVKQHQILLSQNATMQQLQEFAANIMYKYRKAHKYASVLQSILVQVLIRQQQNFTTTFYHVYSHLLDHEFMPFKKHLMNSKEREAKLKIMTETYQSKTMYLLQGNFYADRLCEELSMDAIHYSIQIHSHTLPQFVLKDTNSNEYASAEDLHTFVKNKYNEIREKQMLEEHPELELTKFSPEVDWQSSIWPISKNVDNNNNNNCDSLLKFQYKLKSGTLLTPAIRFQRGVSSTNLPVLSDSMCKVCNHTTQEADLAHIFSHCTIAAEHNNKLWNELTSINKTIHSLYQNYGYPLVRKIML